MKTSFSNIQNNLLTRKFGGTNRGIADPYVTGYHFVWFAILPSGLQNYLANSNYAGTNSGITSLTEVQQVLTATCLSVTPPGGTLNKIEFTGLGGVKWAVPGNIDYGNSVSMKFFELSKTPILDIFHSWFKLIRDYRTGVTDLTDGDTGTGYDKSKYSALAYYWTTAPDAQTVEYYACYDGMFPNKDPQDLFTSDVESVGKLDIEIEFNVDTAYHEKWVYDKCVYYMQQIRNNSNNVKISYA